MPWTAVADWRGEGACTLGLERRLRHDLYYIDNWSLWLDGVVLARTRLVPSRQRHAY